MFQVLRADQVADSSEGISLANSLRLSCKLRVKGGAYLTLVVPGRLKGDLREQVHDAGGPALIGQCYEASLTCRDPQTDRRFLREVVLINLGNQVVTPSNMKPTVQTLPEANQVLWVHACSKWCHDEWANAFGRNPTVANMRTAVKQRLAGMLHVEAKAVDLWGFSAKTDKHSNLQCCVRVKDTDARKIMDSRDPLLFARPFLAKGQAPSREDGVAIVWSSYQTLAALTELANTLAGVRGNVANSQGLGLRVEHAHIAAARKALQPEREMHKLSEGVVGSQTYLVQGLPLETSANAVVHCLAHPLEGSPWKPWRVIPGKRTVVSDNCNWTVRADEEPANERLVLQTGHKLVISRLPTQSEKIKQNMQQKQDETERKKRERREALRKQEAQPENANKLDPWAEYLKKDTARSSQARSGPQQPDAPFTGDPGTQAAISQLRKDMDQLSLRVDKHETKLENLNQTMCANHGEVMGALKAIMAGDAQSSADRKRSPDMGHSPLKAITGGRPNKDPKQ